MRLARFSVQNYRAFADPTELELRPLTLLFGYNSAGKSALLRWLPIVAASTDPDATTALALDAEAARGATFPEILSRYSSGSTLSLGLAWGSREEGLDVQLRLLWEERRKQQIVERMQVARTGDSGASELVADWSLDLEAPIERRRYSVRAGALPPQELELAFEGLVPQPSAFASTTMSSTMTTLAEHMRRLQRDVHWLTALRTTPHRSKILGAPPRRLGCDGAMAGDFLAHDRRSDGRLLATVSRWFQDATGHTLDVRIDSVAGSERFSLVLMPSKRADPVQIPLPDTGEGMAQVMPVIVLGALARHGRLGEQPLLLVEHPELHLHPRIHADLAGFFCALARDVEGSTTVIETHSENILLRVQLAIVRGELGEGDVIVHWVRSLPEGPAVVDSITFDAMARPQGDWPPGVFSSDIRLARELLDLRRTAGAS